MDSFLQELKAMNVKNNFPSLLERKFVQLNGTSTSDSVRIFQWNVLADGLSRGADNFVLCPSEALHWNYRQNRILEEMLRFQPHIFCLEEVDFFDMLQTKLGNVNYKGLFIPKPNSPCLDIPGNMGPDGCAMFYNSDFLELHDSHKICLHDDCDEETNQVAIICKFLVKKLDKELFVAVTHLKAKSGYEELRKQQGTYFLKKLTEIVGSDPLVICGDFNASPKEPVYEEFQKSSLALKSVYSQLTSDNSEVLYTTWKVRGSTSGKKTENCKTIDYIWYTNEKLQVTGILDIPSEENIGQGRLPSLKYPSDHFSLCCDITFK